MSFFKQENPTDTILLEGPNFVLNAAYELKAELWDTYTYPVDGWYWFATVDEAYQFFGLPIPIL